MYELDNHPIWLHICALLLQWLVLQERYFMTLHFADIVYSLLWCFVCCIAICPLLMLSLTSLMLLSSTCIWLNSSVTLLSSLLTPLVSSLLELHWSCCAGLTWGFGRGLGLTGGGGCVLCSGELDLSGTVHVVVVVVLTSEGSTDYKYNRIIIITNTYTCT